MGGEFGRKAPNQVPGYKKWRQKTKEPKIPTLTKKWTNKTRKHPKKQTKKTWTLLKNIYKFKTFKETNNRLQDASVLHSVFWIIKPNYYIKSQAAITGIKCSKITSTSLIVLLIRYRQPVIFITLTKKAFFCDWKIFKQNNFGLFKLLFMAFSNTWCFTNFVWQTVTMIAVI